MAVGSRAGTKVAEAEGGGSGTCNSRHDLRTECRIAQKFALLGRKHESREEVADLLDLVHRAN